MRVLIESHELENPDYQANTPLRCYFCKHEVYGELIDYARERDFQFIVDGTNLDDMGDIRPGRKAAAEYGVRSPLIEAQFTKEDVRDLARALGLPNWHKPAAACLSSRIPHGTPVTIQLLLQVEQAELAVLCRPNDADNLLPIILTETTTLGVRRSAIERLSVPRSIETVETRYGAIRVKVARWNNLDRAAPEYDDCQRAAEASGAALIDVLQTAREVWYTSAHV